MVEEWIQIDVVLALNLTVVGEGSYFDYNTANSPVVVQFSTTGLYNPLICNPPVVDASAVFGIRAAGAGRGFNTDAFNPDAFAWDDSPFSLAPAYDETQFDAGTYQATTVNRAIFTDSGEVFVPVQQIFRIDVFPLFLDGSNVFSLTAQNTLQVLDEVLVDSGIAFSSLLAYNKIQSFSAAGIIDTSITYPIGNILTPTQFFIGATAADSSWIYTPAGFNLKQIFTDAFLDSSTVNNPDAYNLKQIFTDAFLDSSTVNNPDAYNLTQIMSGVMPVGVDEYAGNVVGLLDFNDGYGDQKGHAVAAYDNTSISTSVYKQGGGSVAFTPYGHITISDGGDFSFTGDYTVEFWHNGNTYSGCVVSNSAWTYLHNGVLRINNSQVITGLTALDTSGSWMHVAITRSGSTVRIFVNGVLAGSGTSATTHNWTNLVFGRYEPGGNSGVPYTGNVDSVRITKGIARYTSGFAHLTGMLSDFNVVPMPKSYNWDQVFTASAPLNDSSVGAPNAFNYDQFSSHVLMDSSSVNAPAAFNWLTYADPTLVDNGATFVPSASNWSTLLAIDLLDASTVHDTHTIFSTLQAYNTQFIDYGSVYLIDDIKVMKAIADVPFLGDMGSVYQHDAFNALQVFTGTFNDAGSVYVHNAFNLKQIATLNTMMDAGSASLILNMYNWDQYVGDLLLDAGTTYIPAAFNLKQEFAATLLGASIIHAPTAFNYEQYFTGVMVDGASISVPSAFNLKQVFDGVLTDSGTVSNPVAFNLKQVVTGVAVGSGTVANPIADTAIRKYVFDLLLDSSTVANPSAANKNNWVTPLLVDAASVFAPAANKTKLDDVAFNLMDVGAIYAPNQTNWDSIYQVGALVGVGTVYDDFNASNWTQIFSADRIDADAIFPPLAENRDRTFDAILDLYGEVFQPESIENVDREFQPTTVESGSVIMPEYADIKNRYFPVDVIGDSAAFNVLSVFNLKQVATAGLMELSTIQFPNVYAKTAADVSTLFQTGEQIMSLNLTTNAMHKMVAFAHMGEAGVASMETYAPASMSAIFHAGEAATTSSLIDAFIAFSHINGFAGEFASVSGMDTEPLIYAYSGESVSAGIMTEMIVSADLQAGESSQVNLDTHESFPIGNVIIWNDALGDCTLSTQYAGVSLQPRVIGVTEAARMSFDRPWEMDMALDECCNVPRKVRDHRNVNVVMDNYDDPFEVYYGDKLWASASLSNNHFLRARAYEGTGMRMQDTPTLEFGGNSFVLGEEMSCTFTLTNPLWKHALCKGNFVGEGTDVSIEMLDLLDEKCEEFRIYVGEAMLVKPSLQTNAQLTAIAYDGSIMRTDVYLQQWQATFEFGIWSWCDLQTVPILHTGDGFAGGEFAQATMENPQITISTGESASATITVHHVVNFLEAGGLKNEHLVVNTDGSVNIASSFIIAIEGYYFKHDLKSRSR